MFKQNINYIFRINHKLHACVSLIVNKVPIVKHRIKRITYKLKNTKIPFFLRT